jgi:hypothetical protein
MKKATTLMMGTMVLSATLFANAAFANEAAQPAQAHGWINMPVEDQWVVKPGSNENVTAQSGWISMPVEDQYVVKQGSNANVTTQNGWVAMPVEDQTIVLSPNSEQTAVVHGWVAAPVEDSAIVINPAASADNGKQSGWNWSVPAADSDK